jgi:hypothetical protein
MTDDDQLRRLLSDAVSGIEPHDRLAQIRASVRTDPEVVPMSRPRSWRYGVIGVAATVAVIGGVAVAAGALPGPGNADDHGPLATGPSSSHTTAGNTSSPTDVPSTSQPTVSTSQPPTSAVAVYYVGPNAAGRPVLFREFHPGLPLQGDAAAQQAVDALETQPLDHDYSTTWSTGAISGVTLNGDTIDVTLADGTLHDRPAGMSTAEARAAIQQVIYTVQAAYQLRAPVQFELGGNPIDQVLGQPTSEPLAQGKVLQTLSLVNISSPNEGQQVSGTLAVTGVNNSFEGTSVIYLERNGKKYLVTPTIGGMGGNKLYPWKVRLDLSKVPPARYTLVAQNDDPSGRGHPDQDTRTVIVK